MKSQIRTNSLLLDKLRMLKSDIGSNKEAVVDITKFIELLENPDDSDVEHIVRIVDRHKPKERSDQLIVETFEDKETDDQDTDNDNKDGSDQDDDDIDDVQDRAGDSRAVIPVLLFSCNRVSVSRALDLLISYR